MLWGPAVVSVEEGLLKRLLKGLLKGAVRRLLKGRRPERFGVAGGLRGASGLQRGGRGAMQPMNQMRRCSGAVVLGQGVRAGGVAAARDQGNV
jgi:hypothetical protein